ncbi:MAG: hypothetical protein H6719_30230 [Sandaracinaceae bacterium]|nr:hypothetical protein [Sandaracinaceae bacterium]
MIRASSLSTLCVVAALAAPAAAQEASLDAEARALFDAGEVAYQAGRFEDAEQHFRRSYELSGRSALLYNVGLSAEQARHDEAALEAYRGFVASNPASDRVSRARTRIAALEARLGSATGESSEPGPSDGGASGGGDGGGFVGGVVLIGVGAAAAITGSVLVGLAAADVASVEGAERGTSWASVSDAYERSEALSIAGFVLLGVGVAAAAVGVVLMVSGGGDSGESARLRIGPGSLSLEGAF